MRRILFAALSLPLLAIVAAAPAYAQKQEYPSWMYDQMVPTGPYMRNMEQAQPVPGAAPSHWGSMGKPGEFRAGMSHYGTDVKATTKSYSATHSLAPPKVDVTKPIVAPPRSSDAPPPPRMVTRQ